MYTLAIVGSRDLSPNQRGNVQNFLFLLETSMRVASKSDRLRVISGGAKGVDELVRECFEHSPFEFQEYLPSVTNWEGPGGFKSRNLRIAEECTELYCIRSRQSESYGSGWTADRVEEMGKIVWRYYV